MSYEPRTPVSLSLTDRGPAIFLLSLVLLGCAVAQPFADLSASVAAPAHLVNLPTGTAPPTDTAERSAALDSAPVNDGLLWLITAGGLFALVVLYDPRRGRLRAGWRSEKDDTGRSSSFTQCKVADVFTALENVTRGPVFLQDADGHVQRANAAFHALLDDDTTVRGSRPADLFDVYQTMHATGMVPTSARQRPEGASSRQTAHGGQFVTVEHRAGRSCFLMEKTTVLDDTGNNAGEIVVWTDARTPIPHASFDESFRTVRPFENPREGHNEAHDESGKTAPRFPSEGGGGAERGEDIVLAHIQHEICTPMTSVLGFSEILVDSLQGRERRYARVMMEQAVQVYRANDLFLDIARAYMDARSYPPRIVPLAPLLQRVSETVRAMYGVEATEIDLDVQSPDLRACVDPDVLARVLKRLMYETAQCLEDGTPLRLRAGTTADHASHIRLDVPVSVWETLRSFDATSDACVWEDVPLQEVLMPGAVLKLSYWIARKQMTCLGGTLVPSGDASRPALFLTLPMA